MGRCSVVRNEKQNETFSQHENRKEGVTSHQALRAMTLGAMFKQRIFMPSRIDVRSVGQEKAVPEDTRLHLSHTHESHAELELLTVYEVAAKLRLPKSWVYSHADELGAYRAGKYLRFDWRIVTQRLAAGIGRDAGVPKRPSPPIQTNNRN
jgi:hypothetical protein